jgi:hypothetical protein
VASEPRSTRVPLAATLRRWKTTAGGENLKTTQARTGRRRPGIGEEVESGAFPSDDVAGEGA